MNKNVFVRFPIAIQTKCMSEDALFEQINEIKKLQAAGINRSQFYNMLINAHNGFNPRNKNNFTVDEWVQHFETFHINITSEEIILFFEYLRHFYPLTVAKSEKRFALIKSPNKDDFGLEFIVLRTLQDE